MNIAIYSKRFNECDDTHYIKLCYSFYSNGKMYRKYYITYSAGVFTLAQMWQRAISELNACYSDGTYCYDAVVLVRGQRRVVFTR